MSAALWLERLGSLGAPTEIDAKELARAYGIPVPRGIVVAPVSPHARPAVRPEFPGPYAVKVASPSILHKTDSGALRLGVSAAKLDAMLAELAGLFPGEQLLVEEMVDVAGVELIAGAFRDSALGAAMMVGAGGVLAELYRDVAFRLIPCSASEIDRMVDELRLAPLLRGYRGISVDRPALVGMLQAIAAIVVDLGDRFAELDINPLVYSGESWVALDVKVVLAGAEKPIGGRSDDHH